MIVTLVVLYIGREFNVIKFPAVSREVARKVSSLDYLYQNVIYLKNNDIVYKENYSFISTISKFFTINTSI